MTKQAIEQVQKPPEDKQDRFAKMLFDALEEDSENSKIPFWVRATPQERVAAFDEWVDSHTKGTGIPLEALRRVNLHD